MELKQLIEKIWEDRTLLQLSENQQVIREVIEQLDQGKLRVAEPIENGWQVNEWIKGGDYVFPDPANGNYRSRPIRIS